LTDNGATNDNPMAHEVFTNTQALRVVRDINVKSIAGNCRGKKRTATFVEMVHLYRSVNRKEQKRSDTLSNTHT